MVSVMASLRCCIVMFAILKSCVGLVIGFGSGVYFLPFFIAAKGPDSASIEALSDSSLLRGTFVRDLPGSDGLHWDGGMTKVNADRILLGGKVVRGPDYRLYLTPKYCATLTRLQAINAKPLQI